MLAVLQDPSVCFTNIPWTGSRWLFAVRSMHLHRNVDEAYYVTKGPLGVAMALPNGTIVKQSLAREKVFVVPANYIHTVSPGVCTWQSTI